jgi:hypothetical protein
MSFSRESGETILARHFASVERTDVDGRVTFPDTEAIRRYIRSMTDAGRPTPIGSLTTSGRCARA